MIILKSDNFSSHERLSHFINDNNIQRENILKILQDVGMFTIFFYADDSIKEKTRGLFS